MGGGSKWGPGKVTNSEGGGGEVTDGRWGPGGVTDGRREWETIGRDDGWRWEWDPTGRGDEWAVGVWGDRER